MAGEAIVKFETRGGKATVAAVVVVWLPVDETGGKTAIMFAAPVIETVAAEAATTRTGDKMAGRRTLTGVNFQTCAVLQMTRPTVVTGIHLAWVVFATVTYGSELILRATYVRRVTVGAAGAADGTTTAAAVAAEGVATSFTGRRMAARDVASSRTYFLGTTLTAAFRRDCAFFGATGGDTLVRSGFGSNRPEAITGFRTRCHFMADCPAADDDPADDDCTVVVGGGCLTCLAATRTGKRRYFHAYFPTPSRFLYLPLAAVWATPVPSTVHD